MSKVKASKSETVRWTEVPTQLGPIYLAATDRGVIRVSLPQESKMKFFRAVLDTIPHAELFEDPASLCKTAKQLQEYAQGRRKSFELPLDLRVSPFQGRVLALLRKIPFGETRTYGEIAAMAGRPKAARAVGMACNRNPLPFVIPCHRVIGQDGSLVGFGGGLTLKRNLLNLEQSHR